MRFVYFVLRRKQAAMLTFEESLRFILSSFNWRLWLLNGKNTCWQHLTLENVPINWKHKQCVHAALHTDNTPSRFYICIGNFDYCLKGKYFLTVISKWDNCKLFERKKRKKVKLIYYLESSHIDWFLVILWLLLTDNET